MTKLTKTMEGEAEAARNSFSSPHRKVKTEIDHHEDDGHEGENRDGDDDDDEVDDEDDDDDDKKRQILRKW